MAAYAQLGAEGYLLLRRGASPRVAAVVSPAAVPSPEARDYTPRFNLRPDLPDYGPFPRDEWLSSYRGALKRSPDRDLANGDVRGVLALRSGLVSYLGRVRGVVGRPEHAFACAGFAQAISLVCAVLRRAGRTTIGVEDPGHVVIREIVARSGLEPVPVPVDSDGVQTDALERSEVERCSSRRRISSRPASCSRRRGGHGFSTGRRAVTR